MKLNWETCQNMVTRMARGNNKRWYFIDPVDGFYRLRICFKPGDRRPVFMENEHDARSIAQVIETIEGAI